MSLEACRERFKTFLDQHDLRVTGQRMAIFDAAFAEKTHFTAEELLDKSRAIDASVSRATVYRTLPILIESGLLREVDIGKSLKFYLPSPPEESTQQAQVICVDCDKIFEVAAPFMEWYGTTVSSRLGLSPVSQRLQVSATCNEFRSTGKCKNRR
ncbi:transcriptional repressor [Opitutales bacterium ASA1]|uniref:Fur family transcriptional regulator n=1 Tax=Congregicoccus parvus TaxID=3081749 RepID=UPI002B2BD058|nr:transcriptional repressor [Opitutales bacterium ASA1]